MREAAIGRGRPLRFLMVVMLCWIAGRIAVTQDWSIRSNGVQAAPFARGDAPSRAAAPRAAGDTSPVATPEHGTPLRRIVERRSEPIVKRAVAPVRNVGFLFAGRATAAEIAEGSDAANAQPGRSLSLPVARTRFPPAMARQGRLGGTAWLFWRDGGGSALTTGAGQLGGPQIGARIAYQLIPEAPDRLALYARLTSALRRPFAHEAAVGIAFQPSARLPVRLTIERRANIGDVARNAFAAGIIGGFGPAPIAEAITLEAYGQTGIVGFRTRDAYVDGKLSMMHPLPGIQPVAAGFSLSGGAQPNVARLDVGPQIEARLRLGNSPVRISAEWRQRVAGDARPGSGLAITLASDF